MANNIQAVIWDLDGVIIDSGEDHRKSWQRLAGETGVTFSDSQFWATFGRRNGDIIPIVWGNIPPELVLELGERKEIYYREYIRQGAVALPGAIALLKALHEAGYKQALASSAPMGNIEVVDEVLGLGQYLDALVSGESVAHGKPAPDIFLKAAEELGIAPANSLVIEDAVHGVEGAHAGGMRCIAVMGERDLPGLRKAELAVKSLTEVSVEDIRRLA
ncbi:MAG TPA: HAD family phosphatase [Ktedonobacteraceae bacterium]|jgi:beta-phosphoglucomutase|nr:HAD family phosphatase [Ktedonobacteraceae bacterium]